MHATFKITDRVDLFKGIKNKIGFDVWMSHSDKVIKNPVGFKNIGNSNNTKNAAIYNNKKNIYCLQFHPEVTHTKNGEIIIKNFIYEVCRCKEMDNY